MVRVLLAVFEVVVVLEAAALAFAAFAAAREVGHSIRHIVVEVAAACLAAVVVHNEDTCIADGQTERTRAAGPLAIHTGLLEAGVQGAAVRPLELEKTHRLTVLVSSVLTLLASCVLAQNVLVLTKNVLVPVLVIVLVDSKREHVADHQLKLAQLQTRQQVILQNYQTSWDPFFFVFYLRKS